MPKPKAKTKPVNTAAVLALLRKRCLGTRPNGESAVFLTQVRNATGYSKRERYADAISMGLWPSRGLELEGYEIKVSRSDWQKEIADPGKADEFFRYADRWWLVSAPGVLAEGELPKGWGHLEAQGRRLVVRTEAPELKPKPIPRDLLASLLRGAVREGAPGGEELSSLRQQLRIEAREEAKKELERLEQRLEEAQDQVREIERSAGIRIGDWYGGHSPEEVGAAIRASLEGENDVGQVISRLERLRDQAEQVREDAERRLGTYRSSE